MSVPIVSLELLETKIIPNKQEEIKIIFGKQVIEVVEGEPSKIPSRVTILDKRSKLFDRNIFLDRMREKNMLLVNVAPELKKAPISIPIPTPEIIVPIKTKKRLILREAPSVQNVQALEKELGKDLGKELGKELGKALEHVTEKELETELAKLLEADKTEFKQLVEAKVPVLLEEEVAEKIIEATIESGIEATGKPKQIADVDLTTAVIRSQKVIDRLPKEREKVIVKAPPYYMNNRKIFMQKLTELFNPYRKEIKDNVGSVSCDSQGQNADFDLLTHQKIVRDYLNIYTPYRGLLLYHGLGSGKTCTSIAIAEGMKSYGRRVFVLTPASLKMNFFSEMKKCGDHLYKKNQFWEFISIEGNPDYVGILSKALALSIEYIRNNNGAWLVNINKEPNYTELSQSDQLLVDEQLNEMIRTKYTDINYNGLNMQKIKMLTGDMTHNPFDNAVIVIDEAHNFVSRIVNKIKKPDSISYILYDYLMKATNARIVLLTGTPIINYPNEIGILYNILRGYIKTWTMTVNVQTAEKINTDTILDMFDKANCRNHDYVEYSGNKLTITRNPFGFINTKKRGALKGTAKATRGGGKDTIKTKTTKTKKKRIVIKTDNSDQIVEKIRFPDEEIEADASAEKAYRVGANGPYDPHLGGGETFDRYDGVRLDDAGNISDAVFLDTIVGVLKKNGLEIPKNSIDIVNHKALPDESESFLSMFVNEDTGESKNINLFQRRILGLTSYFRSAQEQLLPRIETTEAGDIYQVVKVEMSAHQFGIYEKIRKAEADREKSTKKQQKKKVANAAEIYTISSTYRIFSRAACNFVFPNEIERPTPITKSEVNENTFDAVTKDARQVADAYANEDDDDESESESESAAVTYSKRIEKAMEDINVKIEETNESRYLSETALQSLSPKFLKVLENISDPENVGLHLLYSHFRTIEGIGIMRLILLAHGFAEFKIAKSNEGSDGSTWEIVEDEADVDKPKFMLYTGTETADEKEILRNVYNGAWDFVPSSISTKLKERAENNMYGEIIKLMMITSSGAEGINLKNTRFVHVVEPYWHMVRVEQVVGRARRICSHQELPEELRTVKVFLYVTMMSEQQKKDEKYIELRIRDVSRLDGKTPVTTDETLYEIASVKQRINTQILNAVKETAIDCNIYSADSPEKLVCYGFGKVESNQFSSYPTFEKDRDQKEGLDVNKVILNTTKISLNGVDYALNEASKEVYDFDSVKKGSIPILIGKLVNYRGQYEIEKV